MQFFIQKVTPHGRGTQTQTTKAPQTEQHVPHRSPMRLCMCVCVHSPYLRKTRILCDIIYIYIQEKRHVYIMYLIPTSRSTNPTAAWTWQDWTMMVLGPAVSVSTHSLVRDVTDQYKCCRATK